MDSCPCFIKSYEHFCKSFKSNRLYDCFQSKTKQWRNNVLDVGTLATAVLVATSPFIFMGYVKYVVHRAEAHLAEYTQIAEK